MALRLVVGGRCGGCRGDGRGAGVGELGAGVGAGVLRAAGGFRVKRLPTSSPKVVASRPVLKASKDADVELIRQSVVRPSAVIA